MLCGHLGRPTGESEPRLSRFWREAMPASEDNSSPSENQPVHGCRTLQKLKAGPRAAKLRRLPSCPSRTERCLSKQTVQLDVRSSNFIAKWKWHVRHQLEQGRKRRVGLLSKHSGCYVTSSLPAHTGGLTSDSLASRLRTVDGPGMTQKGAAAAVRPTLRDSGGGKSSRGRCLEQ